MARIVSKDNYNRETAWSSEHFILWPMSKSTADQIAKTLNEEFEDNERYYKVVDNDYELRKYGD